ncbi:hypothetical protein HYC85_003481 [Camellia sinensis]|uniref:Uncharacterized protein n=1 Tax=Camellia sinensis TaxID=4442 RepID=A0A7J7HVZ6_CAMSI|nr:hypothetical protein HYC85_003481 [Camellia sinensis]
MDPTATSHLDRESEVDLTDVPEPRVETLNHLNRGLDNLVSKEDPQRVADR